eukprot:TRINITY_DN5645_c0_g1_i1.p1 TRINITY_DN5645_c0_g1~~TRINITY_DN5645_c0_g1_i1.p1  ORF type:complete len:726 (-),score=197.55 TRINITY_DN5645_c0_g1_i1:67-2244(-)
MGSKEAVVIILDVGSAMSKEGLEGAMKAVRLLARQKVLFGSKDEIGLVLFGSKETKNSLYQEGEDSSYKFINVVEDVGFPSLSLLRKINEIQKEGERGDLLDALVVGMDLLVKRQQEEPKKKCQKRIFVVTSAGDVINVEGLEMIVEKFTNMEAKLNVIGIDFDEEDEEGNVHPSQNKSELKIENESFLKDLTNRVGGVIVPVNQAIEMMSYFRSKAIVQRNSYQSLEISPEMKISVCTYLRSYETKTPTMEKISTVSLESPHPGTMKAVTQRTYHTINDLDHTVEEEEKIKGYKYGKTLVPFAKIDESKLKYEADRCLKVIGFTNSKNVPRSHFMGTTEMVIPLPADEVAQVALSSLIHALAETESVAIVRYVKRANSIPHLGVLIPHIKPGVECLYFNSLPFAEDLRQYTFPSLHPERARKNYVPNEEQLSAMDSLIDSLDLTKAAQDDEGNFMEALKPKHTYNPVHQHLYQAIEERALNPESPITPLDPVIEKYLNPDEGLFNKAEPVLKKLKTSFPLQKSEQIKAKNERVFWQNSLAANLVKLDSYLPNSEKKGKMEGKNISLDQILSKGVAEVGSIKPVEDFREMLGRRDVDLVEIAMEGMKKRIFQLVNDSILSQLYPKAFDCLLAFRESAILEDESDYFNRFMHELRNSFENKKRNDFWKLVVERQISLITSEESQDSDVSPEDSFKFLSGQEVKESSLSERLDLSTDSVDNLLDMVE